MHESSKPLSLDAATFDPKRWIGAIVGGVVLGEALWSMLQLLIRDWATPAMTNLLGQGPTHNPEAFEPQALLMAFVEVCLAGILLVLILAWTNRGRRVARVTVVRTAPTQASRQERPAIVPAAVAPAPTIVPPDVGQAATPVREQPLAVPQPVFRTETPVVEIQHPAVGPAPEPVATAALVTSPAPTPPAPAAKAEAAPAKAKPKKPKPVYYNIVGEPIESDEE